MEIQFEESENFNPYCPVCNSCGDDGCCSAIHCKQSPNGHYCATYLADLKFAYLMYNDICNLLAERNILKKELDEFVEKNINIIYKKYEK